VTATNDMTLADQWELHEVNFDELDVGLDRELVQRGGLHEFVKIGWPLIEPGEFVDNWHIEAICEHLEAVTAGEIQNLLILQPPSTMKSLLVSTFWPAWEWIDIPKTKFIFCSYGQSLSNKNAKQHRDLLKSDWFQARWPQTQISPESLKQIKMFENTAMGFRFSTSVGGEVTGRHGDRLVFDDLVKAQEADGRPVVTDKSAIHKANQFWFKTMTTREANPRTTSKVGIMQRLHAVDTAQLCIDSGEYEVLRLPMKYERKYHCSTSIGFEDPRSEDDELLWPERFDKENVKSKEKDLGPTATAAQMQQRPTPLGGGIFQEQWFQHWKPGPDGLPANIKFSMLIQSWDMSFKKTATADYVCGQVWGLCKADMYLLDLTWKRMSFTESIEAVKAMWVRWPKARRKLIEEAANGNAVVDTLNRKIPGLVLVSPEGGKEARAYGCEPFWASYNVWLPPCTAQYPWIAEFKKQHKDFPLGAHDDAVDAGTQAVLYLTERSRRRYIDAMKAAKETPYGQRRKRVSVQKQAQDPRSKQRPVDYNGGSQASPEMRSVQGRDHACRILRSRIQATKDKKGTKAS
jgi:predicted phage terminase large subunit-like protein